MKRGGDSTGSRWTPHGPRLSAETAPDRITLRRWLDDPRSDGPSREDAAACSRVPRDSSLPGPGRRGALPGVVDLGGVRVPLGGGALVMRPVAHVLKTPIAQGEAA